MIYRILTSFNHLIIHYEFFMRAKCLWLSVNGQGSSRYIMICRMLMLKPLMTLATAKIPLWGKNDLRYLSLLRYTNEANFATCKAVIQENVVIPWNFSYHWRQISFPFPKYYKVTINVCRKQKKRNLIRDRSNIPRWELLTYAWKCTNGTWYIKDLPPVMVSLHENLLFCLAEQLAPFLFTSQWRGQLKNQIIYKKLAIATEEDVNIPTFLRTIWFTYLPLSVPLMYLQPLP